MLNAHSAKTEKYRMLFMPSTWVMESTRNDWLDQINMSELAITSFES